MKTMLKHITLLLVGRVIIPLFLHTANIKEKPNAAALSTAPCTRADPLTFSFIDDVAAKLLPVMKIFRPYL